MGTEAPEASDAAEVSWPRAAIVIAYLALLTTAGLALAMHFWRVLPLWDHWAAVFLYQRWVEGGWSAAGIMAQHNEHRHALTNLLFIADFDFFRGSARLVGVCLIATQLVLGATLGALATAGNAPPTRAIGIALAIALVAAPLQIDNLILPFHISIPLVCLLALLAFYWTARAAFAPTPASARLWTVAASAAIALGPYAMTNGIIASALSAALVVGFGVRKKTKAILTLVAAASIAFFFWGWFWPKHHEALMASASGLSGIVHIPMHSVLMLGVPGIYFGWNATIAVGVLGVLLWVVAAGVLLQRWRKGLTLDPATLALFGLTVFALATAVMIASARVGAGLVQALSVRYATFSLVFWMALLGTFWRFGFLERRFLGGARRVVLGLSLSLLVLAYAAWSRAADSWRAQVAFSDRATADLKAGRFDPAQLVHIYPDPEPLRPAIEFLRQRKLSIFAPP